MPLTSPSVPGAGIPGKKKKVAKSTQPKPPKKKPGPNTHPKAPVKKTQPKPFGGTPTKNPSQPKKKATSKRPRKPKSSQPKKYN